jgi:hypothetical protein
MVWTAKVRFPTWARNLSLLHTAQIGSWAHPASNRIRTVGSFPGSKAVGAWNWPVISIQCRGHKNGCVIPSLPQRTQRNRKESYKSNAYSSAVFLKQWYVAVHQTIRNSIIWYAIYEEYSESSIRWAVNKTSNDNKKLLYTNIRTHLNYFSR